MKPGPVNNATDIENQVSDLVEVLQDAVKAVGGKPNKAYGRSAPWWNEECRARSQEFRRSRHLPEVAAQARKRFRAAVTDVQIFKVMRWVKPKLCQEPPPLKVGEDRWVSNPLERAERLRDSLMARFNAAHDLLTWGDELPESIPWD